VSWDEEDTGLPPAVGHSPPCLHPALHILLTRGSFGEGESHLEKDSKVIYLTQIFLLYFMILRALYIFDTDFSPVFMILKDPFYKCRIEHTYSTRIQCRPQS
jgi:hypothetical protein